MPFSTCGKSTDLHAQSTSFLNVFFPPDFPKVDFSAPMVFCSTHSCACRARRRPRRRRRPSSRRGGGQTLRSRKKVHFFVQENFPNSSTFWIVSHATFLFTTPSADMSHFLTIGGEGRGKIRVVLLGSIPKDHSSKKPLV